MTGPLGCNNCRSEALRQDEAAGSRAASGRSQPTVERRCSRPAASRSGCLTKGATSELLFQKEGPCLFSVLPGRARAPAPVVSHGTQVCSNEEDARVPTGKTKMQSEQHASPPSCIPAHPRHPACMQITHRRHHGEPSSGLCLQRFVTPACALLSYKLVAQPRFSAHGERMTGALTGL